MSYKKINPAGSIKGDIFLRLSGPKYEMDFFAPFDCEIIGVNPKLPEDPNLSQKNVYEDLWILKVRTDDFNKAKWVHPTSPVFARFVNGILKADKRLQEKCCPDFKQSMIVRRNK